jgi:hypothetical protein
MEQTKSNNLISQKEELNSVDGNNRDIKRYKSRSKTDDSVLANLINNETSDNNNSDKKSNELDNGEVVIMSIQER